MEEDEDVISANSPFCHHLQNLGMESFEISTGDKQQPLKTSQPTQNRKKESIDKNILEVVALIQSTNLLFEDDQELLQIVFSNFTESKNETLKYMLSGKLSAFAAIFGIFLFLYVGYMAFVVVSLFYTYRLTECLWESHRRKFRIKRFVTIVNGNYKIFCRVVKFLDESQIILNVRFDKEPPARLTKCVQNLKCDLIKAQHAVNKLFSEATSTLLSDVPLQQCFDSPDGYICNYLDVDDDMSVSQLHNLYMLLQSQFFTRFAFSLVPLLVTDHRTSPQIVDSIMLKMVRSLREITGSLNHKYKYLLQNGLYPEETITAQALPRKKKRTNLTDYSMSGNIHDLSNSLQYSLIVSRELESSLAADESHNAEKDLEMIHKELTSCQNHISELLILQKKHSLGQKNNSNDDGKFEPMQETTCDVPITDLGFSNLDPHVDDDIFQAVIEDSIEPESKESWTEEVVDPLAKKKQRELLGELKTKLKDKADDWAVRESIVLARKGLAPLENSSSYNENPGSDGIVGISKKCNRFSYGDSSSDDEVVNGHDQVRSLLASAALANKEKFLFLEEEFSGSGQNSESDQECS